MKSEYKVRDTATDSLKYFLICFVIIGHIIEKGCDDMVNRTIFNFIYLFHMPLFVFLSGRFGKVYDQIKLKNEQTKLLYVYLVASFFYLLYDYVLGINNINFYTICNYLFVSHFHLWFLISLVLWRLMCFTINKITPPLCRIFKLTDQQVFIILFIFSLIICLLFGCMPKKFHNVLSLSRTFVFFPYYLLGFITRRKNLDGLWNYKIGACVILIIALISCTFIPTTLPLMFGYQSYETLGYNNFQGICYRTLLTATSVIVSLSIISITRHINIKIFGDLGRNTLIVFVYHLVPVQLLFIAFENTWLPIDFKYMVLYSLLVCFIMSLAAKITLLNNILDYKFIKDKFSCK